MLPSLRFVCRHRCRHRRRIVIGVILYIYIYSVNTADDATHARTHARTKGVYSAWYLPTKPVKDYIYHVGYTQVFLFRLSFIQ